MFGFERTDELGLDAARQNSGTDPGDTMVVPQPAKGQFIDVAAIVSAIGAINTAITNVIGAGLRDISGALGAVNGVLNAIQTFSKTPSTRLTRSIALAAWSVWCRVFTT